MYKPKIFGFKKQLSVGNSGEDLFLSCYPTAKKGDGKIVDVFLDDGKKVEIKTDSYEITKTPNMFIEHFGNTSKKTLGGPYRANKDQIDFFVYLFIKNKTFYWFEPKKLIEKVEELYKTEKLEVKYISNPKYETMGYLIKREYLVDITYKIDDFTNNPF